MAFALPASPRLCQPAAAPVPRGTCPPVRPSPPNRLLPPRAAQVRLLRPQNAPVQDGAAPRGCKTRPADSHQLHLTPVGATQVHECIWKSNPGQLEGRGNYWEDRQRLSIITQLFFPKSTGLTNLEGYSLPLVQIQATHLYPVEKCHLQLVWSTQGKKNILEKPY